MANWTERFSIAGRRALVTGATKGIGRAIAEVFAEAGARVAAVGRDRGELAELDAWASARGAELVTIEADLATVDGPRMAARAALERFDGVDILVNNAGIALLSPLVSASVEDWDRTMNVNLRAPFLLAQAVAPGMIARRMGKIINVSSQTGVIALPDHAAYASSKGGLNALTKSMTAEWAVHNIQCNAICPTVIVTPMGRAVWSPPEKRDPMLAKIPANRFGEPVEVADCALFLASSASDLVNGETLMVDGGYTAL